MSERVDSANRHAASARPLAGAVSLLGTGWRLANYRGVPIPAARHPVWTCTWLCAASAHPRLGPFLLATRRFKNRPLLGNGLRAGELYRPALGYSKAGGRPRWARSPCIPTRRVSELERPQPAPAGAVSFGHFGWGKTLGLVAGDRIGDYSGRWIFRTIRSLRATERSLSFCGPLKLRAGIKRQSSFSS